MLQKNKIIISTQPAEQAAKLQTLLQSNNILFYSMPLIKTQIIKSNPDIEQVLKTIQSFDWVVFTSKRAVSAFFSLVDKQNIEKKILEQLKFAAIGTSTATEILKRNFRVQYINKGNTSKEFAKYLLNDVIEKNDNILLPLGNLAPDFLYNKLSEKAKCTRINVYETIKIKNPNQEILKIIDKDAYNLLIFTSPSAFENFMEITNYTPNKKQLKIITIGQTTTDFIENKGFKVQITLKKSNMENLANTIVKS